METPREFTFDTVENPHAFIQWKGTDVCMDFHCECGAHCHFDGYFAYTVKCPHCQTIWQMPHNIFPRKATGDALKHEPRPLEPDEDHSEETVGAEGVLQLVPHQTVSQE